MRQEKLGFGLIFRMIVSLLPILFGMPVFAVILCAYNIAMSYIVFGPLTSFVSSLCAIGISMLLYGFSFGDGAQFIGLFVALISILCALGCIIGVRGKKQYFGCVWLSSAGVMIPFFGLLRYSATAMGVSVSTMFSQTVSEAIKIAGSVIQEQIPSEMTLPSFNFDTVAVSAGKIAAIIVPTVVIVFSVIIAYAINWAVNAQLRRTGYPIRHKFSQIRIPVLMSLMFVASIVAICLNVRADVTVVCLNLCIIFGVFFFFAGMSLIEHFLEKAHIKRFLRILIHISIVYFGIYMAMFNPLINVFSAYICLAFADSIFNFRKLGKKNVKEEKANETEE